MRNSRIPPQATATFRTRRNDVGWSLILISVVWFAMAGSPATAADTHVLRYKVRAGALVDLGWTGISHAQPWPSEQILAFQRTCPDTGDRCTLGGGKAGDPFGAPIPLSSGGIPACVVNRLRTAVGGTMQRKAGCAKIELELNSRVFMAENTARPCPVCEGDPTANDARREGHCAGGARAGKPCDAHAASARFGASSNDCLPTGEGVGDLTLDLVLETGKVTLESGPPCLHRLAGGTCLCDGQIQNNGCRNGTCAANGRCDEGPFDGHCDGHPYRACTLGSGTKDCEAQFPGAGTCTFTPRACFRAPIKAKGSCDPKTPTFVATFCTPATRAAALNATAGMPGPVRLTLPLELLE